MSRELVTDELWSLVEPLLPPQKTVRTFRDGRKPKPHRPVLEAILFVLKTGIPWEDLPPQFGMSGMTCWRRLRDWNEAGVWPELQKVLLAHLQYWDLIDWSRCLIDSSSVRAVFGGRTPVATRPTVENTGSNTTSSRTVKGHRWSPR
jgi:transposase